MCLLVLFGAIFICGLINSFFYISPKFKAWLYSLLPKSPLSTTQRPPPPPMMKKKSSIDNEELAMVFRTFDRNGDGFITKRELQESLKNMGFLMSDQQISTMVEKVDANGDGLVDVNEFCELYHSMDREEEEAGGRDGGGEGDELREAFSVFDENGDGLITVEELGMVLSSLGLTRELEDCKNMISKVDLDGDGMVNFEEFKRMMSSGRLVNFS